MIGFPSKAHEEVYMFLTMYPDLGLDSFLQLQSMSKGQYADIVTWLSDNGYIDPDNDLTESDKER
jgi:hypothetical protein